MDKLALIRQKDRAADGGRISDDYEPQVFHVFLGDVLNIRGFDLAYAIEIFKSVSPPAADHFIAGEFRSLSGVGLLAEKIGRQKLSSYAGNITFVKRDLF